VPDVAAGMNDAELDVVSGLSPQGQLDGLAGAGPIVWMHAVFPGLV